MRKHGWALALGMAFVMLPGCAETPDETAHGVESIVVDEIQVLRNQTIDGPLVVHATLMLDNVTLSTSQPIVVTGSLIATHTTIQGPADPLIQVTGGRIELHHVTLQDARGHAIQATDSQIIARHTRWHEVDGYGIYAESSDLRLQHVESASSDYGLRIENGHLHVRQSEFSQDCGIYTNESEAHIVDSVFATQGHGLTATDTQTWLSNSTFQGGREALLLTGGMTTARHVHIDGATTGIVAFGGLDFQQGTIQVSGTALDVLEPTNITLEENSILANGTAIRNRSDFTLHAPHNWWGAAPSQGTFQGPVDPTPWKTERP